MLDRDQRAVLEHQGGPLLVLAGPGTGKTTTIVEAVVDRIERRGVDPERVLILTFSRKAAEDLRQRVTARMRRTTRTPLALTFHSYAYALLRREAVMEGRQPPRLLTGPEQLLEIRRLLHGELEEGAPFWPESLREALKTRGFAEELRDFLARAGERGLEAERLVELGRQYGRADWVAAGRFSQRYQERFDLDPELSLDYAELIRAAAALLADPSVRHRERSAYDVVFVDEYQDTDPAQEHLLRHLAGDGRDLIAVGDPDQSIYGFRGADVHGILRFPERFRDRAGRPAPVVALRVSRRSGEDLLAASRRVAARLPAAPAPQPPTAPPDPWTIPTGPTPPPNTPTASPGPSASEAPAASLGSSASGAPAAPLRSSASGAPAAPLGFSASEASGVPHGYGVSDVDRGAAPSVGASRRSSESTGVLTDARGASAASTVDGSEGQGERPAQRTWERPDRLKARGHRDLVPAPGTDQGEVRVLLADSVSQEAAVVADTLRRAHLIEGLPWHRMAVLVRSAERQVPLLRRALVSAGVPTMVAGDEVPLAQEPGVRPLLTTLRVALTPAALDEAVAEELLTGPFGGTDMLGVRRLRRALKIAENEATQNPGPRPADVEDEGSPSAVEGEGGPSGVEGQETLSGPEGEKPSEVEDEETSSGPEGEGRPSEVEDEETSSGPGGAESPSEVEDEEAPSGPEGANALSDLAGEETSRTGGASRTEASAFANAPDETTPSAGGVATASAGEAISPGGETNREAVRHEEEGGRGYRAELPRSSGELLIAALRDARELVRIEPHIAVPAERVAKLIATAREAVQAGGTAEDVIWAVWQASGLAERWTDLSLAGGARGAQADRDLDAVVALFDYAARFVDRMPKAGPEVFLEDLSSQEIPGDTLAERAPDGDAVRVLTAHRAKGLEWDLVIVAGVQEGVWPDIRLKGSLLGIDELVELAEGAPLDFTDATAAALAAKQLAEERRLFYVAATRARKRLVVTAVGGEDADERPSRFLSELMPGAVEEATVDDHARWLNLSALVADLRSVVTDASQPETMRKKAAEHLARLARQGVRGAHPSEWYALTELSDDRPLSWPDGIVRISPSSVESFTKCGLRWLLETAVGAAGTSSAQGLGTVVHALAVLATEDLASEELLGKRLDDIWTELDFGGVWFNRKQRKVAEQMIARFMRWQEDNGRTLVATEESFVATVSEGVQIKGRVDRVERDEDGRAFIIDLKTGTSKPRPDELDRHPQLGVYQLAVLLDAFKRHGLSEPGGAALVQVGKAAGKDAKEQAQPPLDQADNWARDMVDTVAVGMSGPFFQAKVNDGCRTCAARASCPVNDNGGQVC
ncbi:UvrD-helicase domain-containing protein [Nonomuraea dietziae]|uniref:DNA 3'-5' helicase n=1 Tax=Nonomuraea dietziae TaxID=65515 RepID=A0A7W5VFS3_9ACTN|nr:UvrD-helicase domain-containing protein [Nonomuraea dietziae]MBB3730690.1 superfamily I DNA/RNA helicase/RecB family exonuclease [Nonomuraea dietziae]